jgi:hemolysin activation/secretion protein
MIVFWTPLGSLPNLLPLVSAEHINMKNYHVCLIALCATVRLLAADEVDKSPRFPVEQFAFSYGRENAGAPSQDVLGSFAVELGHGDDGALTADGTGPAKVKLSDPLPSGTRISEAALRKTFGVIVEQLNARGFFGVVAMVSREQIDPQSKEDLRPAADRTLKIVVWFSEVSQVRSVAKGGRIPAEASVSNPKHARIVANSPLQPASVAGVGGLFNKPRLDDYLRRLNRHPSRGVEAAISSTEEAGRVVLDYLVTEQKPWLTYAQVSNTGTAATDTLRERVGFVQNQLFNRDDIVSIDYITSSISKANAVFGSYNYPLWYPDKLRARAFGSWGDFSATTPAVAVGGKPERFAGESWAGGAELIASPYSILKFSLDLTAGATVEHVQVKNKELLLTGQADLLTPYLTLRAERTSEIWSLAGSLGYETSFKKVAEQELVRLGRLDTKTTYDLIRGEFSATTYLEPVFFGISGKNVWNRSTLAHEVSLQMRGQYVLGGDRLIPQKEQAIGGYFSARGYPESAVAGDNVYTVNAEYRFHLPRALQPASEREKEKASATAAQEPVSTLFGRPFNLRPPRIYSRPDWDLIFRTFIDAGFTEINKGKADQLRGGENNYTLMSVGVGVELQMLRNLNLRADWGYVLNEIKTGIKATGGQDYKKGANDTASGDSRLHLLLTLVW